MLLKNGRKFLLNFFSEVVVLVVWGPVGATELSGACSPRLCFSSLQCIYPKACAAFLLRYGASLGGPGLQQWKNQFEPELPLAWVIVLPLSGLTRANATSSQIMAMSTRILLCLFPALCSYHYKNMIWAVAADQVIASSNENKYIFSPVVWKKAVSRAAGITHTTWQVFHRSAKVFLMS